MRTLVLLITGVALLSSCEKKLAPHIIVCTGEGRYSYTDNYGDVFPYTMSRESAERQLSIDIKSWKAFKSGSITKEQDGNRSLPWRPCPEPGARRP